MVVKVFDRFFAISTIHRPLVLWKTGTTFSKTIPKDFLPYLSFFLWFTSFNKELCLLNVAVPRKESSSLSHFLGNNQDERN
jgi:hypothetical protein